MFKPMQHLTCWQIKHRRLIILQDVFPLLFYVFLKRYKLRKQLSNVISFALLGPSEWDRQLGYDTWQMLKELMELFIDFIRKQACKGIAELFKLFQCISGVST